MDDLVKRVDEALKDVTPGPWHPTADESAAQVKGFPILESADYVIVGLEGFYDDYNTDWANARFIAAARELVPAMRDRIEADAKRIEARDGELRARAQIITGLEVRIAELEAVIKSLSRLDTQADLDAAKREARVDGMLAAAEIAEAHKPSPFLSNSQPNGYWRGVDENSHSIAIAIRAMIEAERGK